MSGFKKTPSYNTLSSKPLRQLNHNRSSSEGQNALTNIAPLALHISQHPNINVNKDNDKENAVPVGTNAKNVPKEKGPNALSLQLCIQKNEPDSKIGLKMFEPADSENNNSGNIRDYSDSEAAPAPSWSTLPNRTLLYRPLPVDIGRCTCVIVRESSPDGLDGGTLYSLHTHVRGSRQNRKLAVAHHKRPGGRSEFVVAQSKKGILYNTDDRLIGKVTSNLFGSKYQILDQESCRGFSTKKSKLLALVRFAPTVATLTGSYRSMRTWIPKHQSMQLKRTAQIQHINGLPNDWEEKADKLHHLFSKVPQYNKITKQYELDFRDKGRTGLLIQSSSKNFQLILEKNGRQTTLQLGRVGKSKYVMDYRYPLTAYQAFGICLASMDSKLLYSLAEIIPSPLVVQSLNSKAVGVGGSKFSFGVAIPIQNPLCFPTS